MGGNPSRSAFWRTARLPLIGVLLVAVASVAPDWAQASNPVPPSVGAIHAAAGQVSRRAAALAAARVRLAAANARLAGLRTQAEVIIERYDQTMVAMHQAAVAYHAARVRLRRAEGAQRISRARVARMATQAYEAAGSGGGLGSMAAMLGAPGGPQGFLESVATEQQLAQQSTDLLYQDQGISVVAGVFRVQAARELRIERAAAKRATALKIAIQAAVQRQLTAVTAIQVSTRRFEKALGAARAHEFELQQARQRALVAAAAQRRAAAAAAAARAAAAQQASSASSSGPASPSGGWTPGWPSSFPLSAGASAAQGNIAANWALSQLGKPYLWGGAGPDAYDCSGLTMVAWAHAGVTLLHWTGYQWPSGPHIPLSQLRRGDLVFYATNTADPSTIHHVGMYIGNGEMVDAPYTGAFVRIDSIYWPGLIGATRPAG